MKQGMGEGLGLSRYSLWQRNSHSTEEFITRLPSSNAQIAFATLVMEARCASRFDRLHCAQRTPSQGSDDFTGRQRYARSGYHDTISGGHNRLGLWKSPSTSLCTFTVNLFFIRELRSLRGMAFPILDIQPRGRCCAALGSAGRYSEWKFPR